MSSTVERKLAAIMFTDIAGYTEQMSKDESAAIELLSKKESILKPLISEHNGTYVKSTGDGSLSHFNSAVDASMCATKLQESIYDDNDLNVRVGVHLGDTIFENNDIRGDGVNIAARLESMAVEGGVFISKEVYDQLVNQKAFEGISLGLQSLKGVGRLIEVFGLKGSKLSEPNPNEYQDNKVAVHSDDEVPSIAIIPFDNKGADEDVFYAYGISLDLISDVTSAGLIRVASKKQIDEAGEISQDALARKLDVRYLANGELWRMGDMFQLSVELYDTKDKKVIWSDRWQEKWDNLPTIKTSLSDGLLKALDTKPKIEKKIVASDPKAYEYYLQATHKYGKRDSTDDTKIVRGLLQKAIEIDNNLLDAKIMLGVTYYENGDYEKSMDIYTSTLKQAEELGDKRGVSLAISRIGLIYSHRGDHEKGLEYYSRSLAIEEERGDKNGIALNLNNIATMHLSKGENDIALDNINRAYTIKQEIGDKNGMAISLMNTGIVYTKKGDYDKALDYYSRSLEICNEQGMMNSLAYGYNCVGWTSYQTGDYSKSLESSKKALVIVEDLGHKEGMVLSFLCMGIAYWYKKDYEKTLEFLGRSLDIQKEVGYTLMELRTRIYYYLACKHLGKAYDTNKIYSILESDTDIDIDVNLKLFELLDDRSFLEAGYEQVQAQASTMDDELKEKFLSYPFPKVIIEEWEKVQ